MKITNSTKLIIPVYGQVFKFTICFAAALMTALSSFLLYISVIYGSGQGFEDFWPAAIMVILTIICIWFAYSSLRNKIVINNGQIAWGYFSRHTVYIDDIVGITDMRSATSLHGEQFFILRFSDRKDKTHTINVNSKQGKDFVDSMTETFGKMTG